MIPKVGDLVKYNHPDTKCGYCWFCMNNSNDVGIVMNVWDAHGPEPNIGMIVAFDAGEWVFREHDLDHVEILREAD